MSLTVEKCLQAWSNSLRQMNVRADIVFFGDSLTYYGDFASVFPDKVVCNLGLRGDTIQGMIGRVEQIKMLKPKQVFLMAGINDVTHLSPDDFEMLYNRLLCAISRALPEAVIVVQTMLPVNNKDFSISCDNTQIDYCNSRIKKIADGKNLICLDVHALYEEEDGQLSNLISDDGIHIKRNSYFRWYARLPRAI